MGGKGSHQEVITQIFRPIMPVKRPKYYHPFLAFTAQATKRARDKNEVEIDVLDEEAKESLVKEEEIRKELEFLAEVKMARVILEPLLEKESYFISDALKELRKKDFSLYQDLHTVYLQDFLSMSVDMHGWKYKDFEGEEDLNQLAHHKKETKLLAVLTNEIKELETIQGFEMYASEKEWEFADGVKMTDYLVRRKVVEDDV